MAAPETYSDNYREKTFFLWYEGNKRISEKFAASLPEDENGRSPSMTLVEKWRKQYGWNERAELLDLEFSQKLQNEVIEKRTAMYEHHVEVSNALIKKGEEYLAAHEIDSSADALKSISLGIEIQRVSVGQVEMGRKILTMSDEQLEKELQKLLGKPKEKVGEFIIDAEVDEEEESSD